ncbi:MAG: hypothetical protein JSV56_08885 [Methanomassiliicoccales archaeon]|nr:MAG: hypothetical protein JSV56_08885 [Methanomassiliicoccales archaeon]
MIDIVLAIIVGAISLVAALFLPSKTQIENNETARYKSGKKLIYVAGGLAIFAGVLLILLYSVDDEYQKMVNLLKMAFFLVIGITLISVNIKKSRYMASMESAGVPIEAETMVTEVAAEGPTPAQPTVQQVQAQPQVAAQKPAVTTTQAVQARPEQVVVQPTVVATQTVQTQPQVVAAQPSPTTQPKPKIVVIKCPKCQGNMQINMAMLGQKMKCPHCGVEGRIG